jgi:thioredoxin reductase
MGGSGTAVAVALHPFRGVLDVVIVGGGPAGLSAALILGRCRRSVRICDSGRPRNARSGALHGYLTRDGVAPIELLRIGREELVRYGIELCDDEVADVVTAPHGFDVALRSGERLSSRFVLLATGVRDRIPTIDGVDACYGLTVFHCPYCDGWEVRDRPLVVFGQGAGAVALALSLKTWSSDVTICTNGRAAIRPAHRPQLDAHQIAVREQRIARLDHEEGRVRQLVFTDGSTLPCHAMFFTTGQDPQCEIARKLGCDMTRRGVVRTDLLGQTCVPGLFVAGDASRDVQFAIVAAAEGAKAGVAINKTLQAREGLAAAQIRT